MLARVCGRRDFLRGVPWPRELETGLFSTIVFAQAAHAAVMSHHPPSTLCSMRLADDQAGFYLPLLLCQLFFCLL